MKSYRLTVALLLVSGLLNSAAAGDGNLKQIKASNKARAVSAYLDKLGINSPEVRRFTEVVNERLEGDYIRLAEQRYKSGRVVLYFEMQPRVTSKQIQLKFQPNHSNVEYVATPRSVMVQYSYKF